MSPNNLEECFTHLKTMLSDADIDFIKNRESEIILLHHTLGRKLRNQWSLWTESTLKEYFKNLGITHPDDMSEIILTSFHRHLNGLPLNLENQIQKYQACGVLTFIIEKDGNCTPVKE